VSACPDAPPQVVDTVLDGVADLAAERAEAGIDVVLDGLDRELVGLRPVKERIAEIASMLLVERARKRYGLAGTAPTLHMSFTGNPGTGKTTVARKIAEILHRLGYLRTARLVSVTRDDLVGEFIGHTAPKTRDVLNRAAGGVLFIDEAYALHRVENERDYGKEAVDILLQVMETERDNLVVILAGYADQMDQLFTANPGFRSRVAHHIEFPDYTDDELVEIGVGMLAELNYELAPAARQVLGEYIRRRRLRPQFANARSVRNALDRARLRQARRNVTAGQVTLAELSIIAAADLLASRHFAAADDTAERESTDD
jgi:probable Rubsico expression protein CbbX